MRIAIITPVLPPTPGGIGMVALRQAQGLAKLGHEITVFTPKILSLSLHGRGLSPVGDVGTSGEGVHMRFLRPWLRYRHAALVPQLLWHLRQGKFDVIHLHYPFFGGAEIVWLFALFTNHYSTKIVVTYHHDVVGEGWLKKFFAFHAKFVMPRILSKANVVLVSSLDYAKSSLISTLTPASGGASPVKGEASTRIHPSPSGRGMRVRELPFGIDTKIFYPTPRSLELSKKYGIASTDRVVMFLGGLDRAHYFKGVNVLIRAFHAVILSERSESKNPFKLVIVGEGDLRVSYEAQARDLGILNYVIFPGYVSEQEKSLYFNLADIVVLPSIDKSEAFGVVLLEAMACGKPVVASNLPGVRSLVSRFAGSREARKEGTTGLLVAPGSVENLTASLTTLLHDSALRDTMGRAARKRVEEKYKQEDEIIRLEQLFCKDQPCTRLNLVRGSTS